MLNQDSGKSFWLELTNFASLAHNSPEKVSKECLFYKIGFDGNKPRLGWAVQVEKNVLSIWSQKIQSIFRNKKKVIFVGMGGSINTIKMMKYQFNLENILPIDNPDEDWIRKQISLLVSQGVALCDIVVVAISKSATTFETHKIANILATIYKENGLDIYDYMTWVIDEENKAKLAEKGWDIAKISTISIQPDGKTDIGGRFTCPRTALFLLPAYLIEKDVSSLSDLMLYVNEVEQDEEFICDWYNKSASVIQTKGSIYSKMVIIIPDEFSSSYETLRIWINQLIQESLGGKTNGFDPKTLVMLKDEYSVYEESLRAKSIIPVDFSYMSSLIKTNGVFGQLKLLSCFALALEYFTAAIAYRYSKVTGEILNFVNQPNVQLYKEKMKQLKEIERCNVVRLRELLKEISVKLEANSSLVFVEFVYYGPDEVVYQVLKEITKFYFRPDRFELVFRGPDWNHHAFQATTKAKSTLFVVLVDEQADVSVKKVAQATYEVFKEYSVAYIYHWIDNKFFSDLKDLLTELSSIKGVSKDRIRQILEQVSA